MAYTGLEIEIIHIDEITDIVCTSCVSDQNIGGLDDETGTLC